MRSLSVYPRFLVRHSLRFAVLFVLLALLPVAPDRRLPVRPNRPITCSPAPSKVISFNIVHGSDGDRQNLWITNTGQADLEFETMQNTTFPGYHILIFGGDGEVLVPNESSLSMRKAIKIEVWINRSLEIASAKSGPRNDRQGEPSMGGMRHLLYIFRANFSPAWKPGAATSQWFWSGKTCLTNVNPS